MTLDVCIGVPTYTPHVEFSCLADCPNLRDVWLSIDDYCGNCDFEDPTWVNLSTLNDLPSRCSVELGFRDAAMHMKSFEPPAGWSVAPSHNSSERLIFSRNGSQDCIVGTNV